MGGVARRVMHTSWSGLDTGGNWLKLRFFLDLLNYRAALSVPNHPEVARGTSRCLITRAGLTVEESFESTKKWRTGCSLKA